MIIRTWGARHGINIAALIELERMLGVTPPDAMIIPKVEGEPGSEARQQSLVFLEAAQKGVMLFRNNVGALQDKSGRLVRFGLANETEKQNKLLKSSDNIGWRELIIRQEWVGYKIAQFVSREIKHEGWVFDPNDDHEAAQATWNNLVLAAGGDAAFASGPGTL